ncbi:hypothetical protein BKA64DRAFT_766266 [Cadophora sp. MPI-SDFR-AT-0126]|nr:hypothetical protein BKA64DRAFT_766266 [Leotiomycetes sp. MPI-SDFR-AT-0126]
MESTSEEGMRLSYPSVLAGGSKRPNYPSQDLQQTEGQHIEDYLDQSLHATNYTQQKSDMNIVQSVLKAPQHCRTPSDEQETCISDRTVDVACGALDHLLSISAESQNRGDSQTLYIPARPQLHTHIPGSNQDLNATLAQFRTKFQQVFGFVQTPLNKVQGRAADLVQELYRRQSETMRQGRYAAWMMIDVQNIIEAIVGIGWTGRNSGPSTLTGLRANLRFLSLPCTKCGPLRTTHEPCLLLVCMHASQVRSISARTPRAPPTPIRSLL